MSDTDTKEYEIELSRTFTTNGKAFGPGRVKVTKDVADDLKRREHEWNEYEARLIRNNGVGTVEAGNIIGGSSS